MDSGNAPHISSKKLSVLLWLAAGGGAAAGLTIAVGMVSNFEFSLLGAYVSYGPPTAGAISIIGSGSLAVVGATSLGVGVGVAAAIYFIPWSKFAKWAAKAWDLFLGFMKSV